MINKIEKRENYMENSKKKKINVRKKRGEKRKTKEKSQKKR